MKKAFTLIEVLVALGLFAGTILILLTLFGQSLLSLKTHQQTTHLQTSAQHLQTLINAQPFSHAQSAVNTLQSYSFDNTTVSLKPLPLTQIDQPESLSSHLFAYQITASSPGLPKFTLIASKSR